MNFVIITMAAGAVVLLTTAIVTWPRRHAAHWVFPFLGLATAVSIWLIGYALELSVFGLEKKIFWAQIQYIGISFTPVAWFIFAYQFLRQNPLHLKPIVGLLMILPVVTIVLAFTNSHHNLLWTQNVLDESGSIPLLANSYGGWFWVHSTYSYLLILGGIGLFLRTTKLHPGSYRWQSIILILAAVAPMTGNILYLTGNAPLPWFDPTPISFALSALLIIWGVARLDLFDIVPIARRVIVENLPDGIVLLNEQNHILDINQTGSKLLGQNNQHVVGLQLNELTKPLAQKIEKYRALEVDEEIGVEQDGKWQHYSVKIRPLYLSGTQPHARILILRDISRRIAAEAGIRQRNVELQQLFTDAQEAREAAEKANKAKSELLAKVSHELRTPLGAILGYAEMLQEGVYGPVVEEQDHSLSRIIENSNYLNEQVNDLLESSRLDSGKLKIETYEFDLEDTLEQVRQRIQPTAVAKNLTFSIELAPNMPKRITSNAIRIQQILINLCTNAIKFTDAGYVHVTIEKVDVEHWQIRVSDSGKGIPDKDRKTIFLPFHQLQAGMLQGQNGVGLGLTIVKELVAALSGTIEVESEEQSGSTFIVSLPFCKKLKEETH
ncbi:histidine kinase N-terminal 7TM domain-containing protein [Candidatus Leptofilum sp.]|uniref:histidine kinase N-terminal 7TM domain-containing protein n=1 Tax=Candidatus Leptofilum sp. TaxID=3241576 RepID=UPI003B5B7DAD